MPIAKSLRQFQTEIQTSLCDGSLIQQVLRKARESSGAGYVSSRVVGKIKKASFRLSPSNLNINKACELLSELLLCEDCPEEHRKLAESFVSIRAKPKEDISSVKVEIFNFLERLSSIKLSTSPQTAPNSPLEQPAALTLINQLQGVQFQETEGGQVCLPGLNLTLPNRAVPVQLVPFLKLSEWKDGTLSDFAKILPGPDKDLIRKSIPAKMTGKYLDLCYQNFCTQRRDPTLFENLIKEITGNSTDSYPTHSQALEAITNFAVNRNDFTKNLIIFLESQKTIANVKFSDTPIFRPIKVLIKAGCSSNNEQVKNFFEDLELSTLRVLMRESECRDTLKEKFGIGVPGVIPFILLLKEHGIRIEGRGESCCIPLRGTKITITDFIYGLKDPGFRKLDGFLPAMKILQEEPARDFSSEELKTLAEAENIKIGRHRNIDFKGLLASQLDEESYRKYIQYSYDNPEGPSLDFLFGKLLMPLLTENKEDQGSKTYSPTILERLEKFILRNPDCATRLKQCFAKLMPVRKKEFAPIIQAAQSCGMSGLVDLISITFLQS